MRVSPMGFVDVRISGADAEQLVAHYTAHPEKWSMWSANHVSSMDPAFQASAREFRKHLARLTKNATKADLRAWLDGRGVWTAVDATRSHLELTVHGELFREFFPYRFHTAPTTRTA